MTAITKTPAEKALVLAAYASYLLAVSHMKHAWRFPETLVTAVALIALAAAVSDKYPGTLIVLLTAVVASHLCREYVLGGIEYSLPHAQVAVCTFLALLAIPAYLAVTCVRKSGEAIVGGFHVVAYAIAVSWIRSLEVSAAAFAGLSAVTASPTLLTVMTSSYAALMLTTIYVATFSTTDPGRIGALPVEFLRTPREHLGAWALVSLAAIVALFSLGFLVGRLVRRLVARVRVEGSAAAVLLSELLPKVGLAAATSSVAAAVLGSSLEGVAAATAFSTSVVSILGLAESYLSLLDSLRHLTLECQDLSESVEREAALSREALKYLQHRGFTSPEKLERALGAAERALMEFRGAASLGMLGYSRVARACLEMRRASVELSQRLVDLATELSQIIKSSLRISAPEVRETMSMLLAELEATFREPERLLGLYALLRDATLTLERYCDDLVRTLTVDIPSFYREVLGSAVSIRELPSCSGWSVGTIRALQDYVEAFLIDTAERLEPLSAELVSLSNVARDLRKALEAYGFEHERLAEFLEYLQGELSQIRLEMASGSLSGLALLLGIRRALAPRAVSTLEVVLELKESPIGHLMPDQLKTLEDALKTLSDPELPLSEAVSALRGALMNLPSSLWTLSGIGKFLELVSILRLLEPVVLDYVRDAVKRGYKFEEVFPLRDDLREVWVLLYGRGGEDVM